MIKFKRTFFNSNGLPIRRKDYLDNAYAECRGDRDVFISAYESSDLRFFASSGEAKDESLLRRNAIGAFNKLHKLHNGHNGHKLATEFYDKVQMDFEGLKDAYSRKDKEGVAMSLEFIRVHIENYGWVFEKPTT